MEVAMQRFDSFVYLFAALERFIARTIDDSLFPSTSPLVSTYPFPSGEVQRHRNRPSAEYVKLRNLQAYTESCELLAPLN